MITDHQAKYFAHELTRRCPPDSIEKLAGAVAGAQVDLNPHQVDAALFAFSSPLSKGALLADEVGLGKTIEAGLTISQRWAERKRRVLVITPSNLRKQWHQELTEKFFLPCKILESRSYNDAIKVGNFRPFDVTDTIIICSYQFARNKAADVHATPWDLVVIDEAHRLRNVYKPSNIIANTLKQALAQKQKLLLTATPLQNSLLELFGLVSFIDEHAFGDLKSFREQFSNLSQERMFHVLRDRLKPICHRTLRRQVTAYVSYTRRLPIVEEFSPEEGEDRLYHLVSEYLQRDNLQALPASQRSLMTLVLRKLLASSTFAIAGALSSMSARLQAKIRKQEAVVVEEDLGEDYEAFEATEEEWSRSLPPSEIEFDYSNHPGKITILEPIRGQSGWLMAALLTVDALDQTEDHILLVGETDNGAALGEEACTRLLSLNGRTKAKISLPPDAVTRLALDLQRQQNVVQDTISERNARFFEIEAGKLDGWADDLKVGLEREIKEIDRQIKEARRAATVALTLEEKLAGQKQIKSLESLRNTKRRSLFDAQDDKGGVTEAVAWQGGGGFRYYRPAPSLLEKDRHGREVISKAYNAAMLAEALCKLEGFTYAPSETVYWQHGYPIAAGHSIVRSVAAKDGHCCLAASTCLEAWNSGRRAASGRPGWIL